MCAVGYTMGNSLITNLASEAQPHTRANRALTTCSHIYSILIVPFWMRIPPIMLCHDKPPAGFVAD